jgi:hypothetical protein
MTPRRRRCALVGTLRPDPDATTVAIAPFALAASSDVVIVPAFWQTSAGLPFGFRPRAGRLDARVSTSAGRLGPIR